MTATLSELRTEIQQRADIQNSNFFSDAELNNQINRSLGTLRDKLILAFGNEGFISDSTDDITLVADTSDYSIDSTIYKVVYVDYLRGGVYYDLDIYPNKERNYYQSSSIVYYPPSDKIMYRYRIVGRKIRIKPTPKTADGTVHIHYIPKLTVLSGDSDTTPVAIEDQWLEWVVLDCVIKCNQKRKKDVSTEMGLKKDIEDAIKDAAENTMTNQVLYCPDSSRRFNKWDVFQW